MPLARVIPIRRPQPPAIASARAEPGLVVLEAPGEEPKRYSPAEAIAAAHVLLTLAEQARHLARDERRRR